MEKKQDVWMCTECGYTSPDRFIDDICPRCGMTYWHCSMCGFTLVGTASPDICPECHAKCEFINIGCYIPGWRETDTINPYF